jgi:hypothetical protein
MFICADEYIKYLGDGSGEGETYKVAPSLVSSRRRTLITNAA